MTKNEDNASAPATSIPAPLAAEVKVAPFVIPPSIAGNLLEFLRRVESKGMEAVAWVEAYNFVQQHASQNRPGVPFGGLPPKG